MDAEFEDKAQEKKKLMLNLVHKDVFHRSAVVEHSDYEAFCRHRQGTVHRFYRCMLDYLLAYMSLREIISMDSSLRITTIQSLGESSSSSVFPARSLGFTNFGELFVCLLVA